VIALVERDMDVDCQDALQRIAAHTLIVAERCKDRHIQARLIDIANELIEMMVGQYSPTEKPERVKFN
jgi:hypothetical protein